MKTKNNFNFLILLILPFLCQPFFAYSIETDVSDSGKLSGKIIDKATNLPLEDLSVVIYSSKGQEMIAGTISNADGSFHFYMLKPGNYFLEVNLGKDKIVQFPEFALQQENDKIDMGELGVIQTTKKQKTNKNKVK